MVRKGERGKGMGHWIFCVHRTLCLGLSNTQLPFIPHTTPTHLHNQQPTKCGDWAFCKNNAWMLHKFLLSLTPNKGCPLCVGSQTLPHPLPPFPFFSPMGRLLSSWPAHGEKRGRGEGMGHCIFWLHRTLYLGWALSVSVCTGFFTWVCPFTMTELCTNV